MTEPIYIAQTFEREHTITNYAIKAWFSERSKEARERGAPFGRATFSSDGGLLFEAWTEGPDDQGAPRWSYAAPTPPLHPEPKG